MWKEFEWSTPARKEIEKEIDVETTLVFATVHMFENEWTQLSDVPKCIFNGL